MKKEAITEIDKDKALEQVMADIEKQFGKGAIMKLGDDAHMEIEITPSGSLALDVALGVGGFPKGRIIEVYGPESSGKTTIALQAIAEVQKRGGRVSRIRNNVCKYAGLGNKNTVKSNKRVKRVSV